jgi:hypothetical protein
MTPAITTHAHRCMSSCLCPCEDIGGRSVSADRSCRAHFHRAIRKADVRSRRLEPTVNGMEPLIPAALAHLWMVRRRHRLRFCPRNHPAHVCQDLRQSRRLSVLLKDRPRLWLPFYFRMIVHVNLDHMDASVDPSVHSSDLATWGIVK